METIYKLVNKIFNFVFIPKSFLNFLYLMDAKFGELSKNDEESAQKAINLIEQHDYNAAISYLRNNIKKGNESNKFHFLIMIAYAMSYYDKKDYEVATQSILNAIEFATEKHVKIENSIKSMCNLVIKHRIVLIIFKDMNIKKANQLYISGCSKLKYDIEGAINDFQEAVKLNPREEYKKALYIAKTPRDNNQAEQYFRDAINYLNDGNFEEAKNYFQYVRSYNPNNKEVQKYIIVAEASKLNVETCTKKGIMTLSCINEELAEQFISARNDNIMWYSYEELASFLSIQPNHWMELEEKLVFPSKPNTKIGRKLDL